MSENLEKALEQVVNKALQVAEQTGQFVIEQAPELLQEFYRWNLAKNSITVVLVLILGILFHRFVIKKLWNIDNADAKAAVILVGIIYYLISLFFFIKSAYQIVFILIAPKLYLIEYFVK